jgi:hypothetical protein
MSPAGIIVTIDIINKQLVLSMLLE